MMNLEDSKIKCTLPADTTPHGKDIDGALHQKLSDCGTAVGITMMQPS